MHPDTWTCTAARLCIHGTRFMSRARTVVRYRGIPVDARCALRAAAGFAEGWVPGQSRKGNSDIQWNMLFGARGYCRSRKCVLTYLNIKTSPKLHRRWFRDRQR